MRNRIILNFPVAALSESYKNVVLLGSSCLGGNHEAKSMYFLFMGPLGADNDTIKPATIHIRSAIRRNEAVCFLACKLKNTPFHCDEKSKNPPTGRRVRGVLSKVSVAKVA